jgi:hypothetical protein
VRALRAILFVGAAPLVVSASCLDPTEIRPEISTDVDCATVVASQVDIRVGSPATVDGPNAQLVTAYDCTPGAAADGKNAIGDLVITPSGAGDTVAVTVVLGVDRPSSACVLDAPAGCIVARRTVGYVLHREITLPIELSSKCTGVKCASDETCQDGECVPAALPDGGTPEAGTPDAGCGDTSSDPQNCGRCGFDCTGGSCQNGLCSLYPGAVTESLAPGACLAVSAAGVFVTTGDLSGSGDVLRFPKSGGVPTFAVAGAGPTYGVAAIDTEVWAAASYAVTPMLQSGQSIMNANPPYTGAVATDGTIVCAAVMTSPGAVECAPGGLLLSPGGGQPVKLAMSSGFLYATWSDGSIYKVDVGNAALPNKLVTAISADGIAIATLGQVEYFASSSDGRVERLDEPKTTTALFTLSHPRGVAFDPVHGALYVADEGTGASDGAIYVASSGSPAPIAGGQNSPNCIAIDDQAVYWLDGSRPMKAPR